VNVKLYIRTSNFLQRSVATDLRGGGCFDSSFLHSSFLNLTVKKNKNWCSFAKVVVKNKSGLLI